jgi:predicted RNA-binding protein associated with RNAse of E/G family
MSLPHPTMKRAIREVKETLAGERREFHCTLVSLAADEVVVGYRSPIGGIVADVSLPAGTLTLGYFWAARPYNAYHWLAPDGATLGLYFNVSDRTRITAQRVAWRDLVVDVLVTPDGRCRVLDEDELPVDLDVALRHRIESTRDALRQNHERHLEELETRSRALIPTIDFGSESGVL